MDKTGPKWTNEEAGKLKHEAFIAEILRVRALPISDKPNERRIWRFLESIGGTAFITVLIGGWFGSCITAKIQERAQDREFEQAQLKTRGDLALLAYKDYLEQQRETMKHAFELIGNCISTSEDLIDLTGPNFDRTKYPGVEEQRKRLRVNYNHFAEQWQVERDVLGLTIGYYHSDQPGVREAWTDVKNSVTELTKCAQDWYLAHNTEVTETSAACSKEKKEVETKLDNLSKASVEARQYFWKEFGVSGQYASPNTTSSKSRDTTNLKSPGP
jgi:hypothetical protein